MSTESLPGDLERAFPICTPGAADTTRFDEALELLNLAGRPLHHAILMMIPEAWENHESMDAPRKAFYRYHASLMEPWDGPASIAFTDGTVIGAVLDRNGLRPSRYWVTDDDRVIMASEVGVLDVPPDKIVKKGRLEPGKIFLVDTTQGRIIPDDEIKAELAARAAVPGVARRGPRAPRRPAAAVPARAAAQQRGATAAHVRLHARRPAADHRADGAQRGREPRLDGHRHAGPGDLRPAAHALRVLQAVVRAGHEPAARRQLRSARHVAQLDARSRGQPARPAARSRVARSCARRRSSPTKNSPSCATSTTATTRCRASRRSPSTASTRSPIGGDGPAHGDRQRAHAGERGDRRRRQPHHPLRPLRRRRRTRRSPRCSSPPRCTTISCARRRARVSASSSRPARRARCITSPCCSATARARSTRTSRSTRSATSCART